MTKQILALFLFLGVISSLFGSTIEERVKQIPLHERICMRYFFDFAIKTDQAAHVLFFDNKPVCFTDVVIKYKHKKFSDKLCLKGWYAFKKHEHLFPHSNFIINEKKCESDGLRSINIFIINKIALAKCLQESESLFKESINNFTSEWFITELENGIPITSLIQDNEMLFGILLGYGEESSRAFKEAHDNYSDDFAPQWSDTYCSIRATQPNGCKMNAVGFMGNPTSPKAQQLISVYENELKTIWDDYQKKNDSLLFFLKHLCRERS